MMRILCILQLTLFSILSFTVIAQPKSDPWFQQLLNEKASPFLQTILFQPDSFQYQVIYTKIDRDKKNNPHFTNYYLNVDRNRYFNPASTVKLPTALAALEKLNRLQIKSLYRNTSMLTDSSYSHQTSVFRDTSSASGLPSIEHYIKKIFFVSDNDAYNRLYEFTGQQTLNEFLWKKGYKDVRITRRFVPMTEEENRHTNSIRFTNKDQLIYQQPAAASQIVFNFPPPVLIGHSHYDRNDSLLNKPMDFTKHNNLPLEDLQKILQSVIFPESVPKKQRFKLTKEDYHFLYHYMSAYPSESSKPKYDTTEFFDSYTKFFYKAEKQKIPTSVRIFNKPGWSYGFLTDAAYVIDTSKGIEFMLSAVIYVNKDGILNDNRYEYESVGYPFFNELYRIITAYEAERNRKYPAGWRDLFNQKLSGSPKKNY